MITLGMVLHLVALVCFLLAALDVTVGRFSPIHLIAIGLFLAGVRQMVR